MRSETEPRAGHPRQSSPLVAVGDGAVFMIFTVIGLSSHRDTFTPDHFLRNFIPLTVCWFLIALAIDTYGRGGAVRVVANWGLGVTAAVIVRTWWVGSPNGTRLWTFLAVSLATNGVGLLVWRLAASRLLGRGRAAA